MTINNFLKRLRVDFEGLPDRFDVNSALIFEFIRSNLTSQYRNNIDSYESFTLNRIILDLQDIIDKTNFLNSKNDLFDLYNLNFPKQIYLSTSLFNCEFYIKKGDIYKNQIKSAFYWTIANLRRNEIDCSLIVEGIQINELDDITLVIIYICKLISLLFTTNNVKLITKILMYYHQRLMAMFNTWVETTEGKNQLKTFAAKKGKRKQNFSNYIKKMNKEIDRIKAIILFLINNKLTDKHIAIMEIWQNEVKNNKHPAYFEQLRDRRKLTSHDDYRNIKDWIEYIINQKTSLHVEDINDNDEALSLAISIYFSKVDFDNKNFISIVLNGKNQKIEL